MPRRGQHDQSPWRRRKPFSDQGGPEGRHAQTHDVEREEASRPKAERARGGLLPGPGRGGCRSRRSRRRQPAGRRRQGVAPAARLRSTATSWPGLSVLTIGTRLEQGGTYVDLNDLAGGPFKAIGSQEAGPDNSYVAKRDTDYELWNRLWVRG
ncbi:MAG: hypothetical protein WKG07_46030 [Hymenobacter sp.]